MLNNGWWHGRGQRLLLVLLGGLTVACNSVIPTDVGNLNSGSTNELLDSPTATSVNTAATGLLLGARLGIEQFVTVSEMESRDGYWVDPGNPQITSTLLRGPITPGTFGAPTWGSAYRTLRQATIVLAALSKVGDMGDAEKAGVAGFVRTVMAYELWSVITFTDVNGAVTALNESATSTESAPVASKSDVYKYIVSLLDQAATDLGKAGGSFSMQLPSGFAGFSTPATFLTFNRGLKARVEVDQKDFAAALTALQGSFLSPTGAMDEGVYLNFSTASGDMPNPLYDPKPRAYFAHGSLVSDAQMRGDGSPDLRLQAKVETIASRVQNGITVDNKFIVYNSPSDPVPIMTNEQLLLIRAEARLGTGDRQGALEDLNTVRVQSGGLDPLPSSYSGSVLDELLYNIRYSLVWTGPYYWSALRRYDLLGTVPKLSASDKAFPYFPFPASECVARNDAGNGCKEVAGL